VHLHERWKPMERIGCSWTPPNTRWKIHGGETLRVSPDAGCCSSRSKRAGNARELSKLLDIEAEKAAGCSSPGYLRASRLRRTGRVFAYAHEPVNGKN